MYKYGIIAELKGPGKQPVLGFYLFDENDTMQRAFVHPASIGMVEVEYHRVEPRSGRTADWDRTIEQVKRRAGLVEKPAFLVKTFGLVDVPSEAA